MNNKKPSTIIKDARKLLKGGERWITGSWVQRLLRQDTRVRVNCYCLEGALNKAAGFTHTKHVKVGGRHLPMHERVQKGDPLDRRPPKGSNLETAYIAIYNTRRRRSVLSPAGGTTLYTINDGSSNYATIDELLKETYNALRAVKK